jgi:hypothetical protein
VPRHEGYLRITRRYRPQRLTLLSPPYWNLRIHTVIVLSTLKMDQIPPKRQSAMKLKDVTTHKTTPGISSQRASVAS